MLQNCRTSEKRDAESGGKRSHFVVSYSDKDGIANIIEKMDDDPVGITSEKTYDLRENGALLLSDGELKCSD